MAPEAAQRAPFEEDGRPYPRPVVDGKFLDVENDARLQRISLFVEGEIYLAISLPILA